MRAESALKVGILSTSNYICVLASTILFPIFPAMARALDLTLQDLALLVLALNIPAMLVNPFGGMLADRFGRKLIIVGSLFLYGLGGLLAGAAVLLMASPFPVILAARIIQGVGSATPMFLTVTLVGDIFHSIERSKAAGFLESANGLGKVSSPILGGLVGLISWKAIFFLYPLLAFPTAAATWIFIQEPQEKVKIQWDKQKEAFLIFKKMSRILTLVAAFLVTFMLIGLMFWMSDYLAARMQLNKFVMGVLIALPAAAMMITTLFAGLIAKRFHPRYTMGGGMLTMAAGYLLLAFSAATPFFWAAVVIIGIGSGIVFPAVDTVSTSVKNKHIRGIVATIYGSLRSAGAALAPLTISFLLGYGLKVTFLAVSGLGLAAAAAIFILMQVKDILPDSLLPKSD